MAIVPDGGPELLEIFASRYRLGGVRRSGNLIGSYESVLYGLDTH